MSTVPDERIDWIKSLPFIGAHVAAITGVAIVGVSPHLIGVGLLGYAIRMWAITTGHHRYFSHRGFKTSRPFQFILGLLGTLAAQKGPLWWGAHHRWHHSHADQEDDTHSPMRGFFWAHIGWILCSKYEEVDLARIKDFARYPELVWLNHLYLIPPIVANALLWIVFGPAIFVWGGLVGTVLSWHAIFSANSVCHMFGTRRFDTKDTSRNNLICAILLLGEGWHNNHHRYATCARQGFYWWELDLSYYIIKLLEKLQLVWDVREVPPHILEQGRRGAGTATPTAAS